MSSNSFLWLTYFNIVYWVTTAVFHGILYYLTIFFFDNILSHADLVLFLKTVTVLVILSIGNQK